MPAEHWEELRRLFFLALDRPPEDRPRFLDEVCAGDAALRGELESLLQSHEQAGDFLERPAVVDSSRPMPLLAAGQRLGPYEIAAVIGSGGMGLVYRARDTRLERDVAIKVLPTDLADAERRRRFEQEARAASALNHPNIVAVYDVGSHEGAPFLVTELLRGQSLAERTAQGPLPTRKALEYAVQVARGLAAAHERGIVHRDVKPANLFATSDGHLKILDFGVAKLLPSGPGMPAGPVSTRETTPGLVVGTVGFMAPEQLKGGAVDGRADQFSLGCVLYALLAGQEPFARPSAAQTLEAVLRDEPVPLARVNARVPRAVSWIVERCLAKDPQDRYRSTHDLARDLELAQGRLTETGLSFLGPLRFPRRLATAAALAAMLIATGLATRWWIARAPVGVPQVRYLTYSGRDFSPAAAPDGSMVAFSSNRDGRRRIWLKQLSTGNEAPLTEGEDDHPRFSPDGATLLFARNEGGRVSLYRVPTVGGEARKLVDDALYGDFSPDGRRLAFVRQAVSDTGMTSVVAIAAADGSSVRELARLDGTRFAAGAFVEPRWSPNGRYLAATQSTLQLGEPTVIALVDAENGQVQALPPPSDAGVWRGGLVWSGDDGVLCAQPESVVGQQTGTSSRIVHLDLGSRRTRPLLSSPVNLVGLDVLGPERLVLEARSLRQNLREIPLAAKDGTGERWLTMGNGADRQPIYTRDGEWIAFSSNRSGNLDVWAVSRRSGAIRRLTDDPAHDSDPHFMPDGRLLWSSNRSGRFEIWIGAADGSGARQLSRDGVDAENPVASPDGQWIVYASANPASRGLVKMRADGREAALLVPGNRIEPEISPDGRFVAFVADVGSDRAMLSVVRLSDGAPAGFDVRLPPWTSGAGIDQGRCRWMSDSRALAYIAQEPGGTHVVYVQDFIPGTDTTPRRRRIAAREPDLHAESLGVSPDGTHLTVSFREQRFDLMLAEGVPGVD